MNKPFITENVNNLYSVLNIIAKYVPSHWEATMYIDNTEHYERTHITINVPTEDDDSEFESTVKYSIELPCEILYFMRDDIKLSYYNLQELIELLESDYNAKLLKHYDESIKEVAIKYSEDDLYTSNGYNCAPYQYVETYGKNAESLTKDLCRFYSEVFNLKNISCTIIIDPAAYGCLMDGNILKNKKSKNEYKVLKYDRNLHLHNVIEYGNYVNGNIYINCDVVKARYV